jgi:hypothetical protein
MRLDQEQADQALAEFLANGGKIQQCGMFESGRAPGEAAYSAWGKPKKKKGEEPTLDPTEDVL